MRLFGFLAFALKRLKSRTLLTILLALCIALTVAVMVCVPVFAGAVSRSIMRQELALKSKSLNRPLFTVRMYALPRLQQPMTLAEAAYARDWIAGMLRQHIGLPIKAMYVENESPPIRMRPRPDDSHYTGEDITSTRVVIVQGVEKYIKITNGAPFGQAAPSQLSVWVLPSYAEKTGVQIGEVYHLSYFFRSDDVPISVKIAGYWEAADPNDRFWYDDPRKHFNEVLLTTVEEYNAHLAPIVPEGTGVDFWYFVLDDSKMNFDRAEQYVKGLDTIEQEVVRRLPRGAMDIAPSKELLVGRQRKTVLSLLLLGLSLPLMGILVFFIVSASTIVARFQTRETAMLVSRGTGRAQVLAFITLETVIILAIACPLGVFLGMSLARLLGYSLSFLSFVLREPLEVNLASVDWRLVALAAVIGFVARLVPTWIATRSSIVAHERQVARRNYAYSAMRFMLTLILIAVTYYAYRQLAQRGTLGLTGWQPWDDPRRDPLLLIAPALFVFTASLVASELFTILMLPFTLIGRILPSASAYLSCINLGREGGQYRTPTYMLVLALSMGVFYASMAKSADIWLVDQLRYRVGADLAFVQGAPGDVSATEQSGAWVVPVDEYRRLDGISRVTRIGEYVAAVPAAKGLPRLKLMGIDRLDFPHVTYFRPDFSRYALGDLMNRLGGTRNGILISSALSKRVSLGEGDRFPLDVSVDQVWYRFDFQIVGIYDYFPTMYEKKESVVVVNLDYLDREVGGLLPPGIWARLDEGVEGEQILDAALNLNVQPIQVRDLGQWLADDLKRLERVGIFGLLSIAFLAGAFLSGADLLVYNSASMSGRSYRFAMLRAMGMSRIGVIATVTVEYIITLLYGIGAGTVLGLLSSRLYVPFFPLTETPEFPIPPFIAYIDWERAAWLAAGMGIVLIVVESLVLWRVARARMFEVLRLGTRE